MCARHGQRGRYDPAMRRIWPWPAVLLEAVAGWINDLPICAFTYSPCSRVTSVKSRNGEFLVDFDQRPAQSYRAVVAASLLQAAGHSVVAVDDQFTRAGAAGLPLASGSLDGIVSVETLEHVVGMDLALREFARCLRNNGYLVMTIPSVTVRSWWQMRVTREPAYCDPQEHVREFTAVPVRGFPHMFETGRSLEARVEKTGFAVMRAGGVGFLFPMWQRRLAWMERTMNLLYRETINRWLGRLPVLRRFPYYRIYVLRYEGKG